MRILAVVRMVVNVIMWAISLRRGRRVTPIARVVNVFKMLMPGSAIRGAIFLANGPFSAF